MTTTPTSTTTPSSPADPATSDRASLPWRVALVAFAVTLVVTRVAGLSRSLWWDEAFTANRYVRDPATILDPELYNANNHVLFSYLSAWTSRLFGTDESVLRLWAVLPGLVAAGLLTWWLWRRWSPAVAVSTLAFTTLSWVATQLHTEARGYGLVLLCATVLLVVPAGAPEGRRAWGGDLAVAAAGVIGMLTYAPFVMLYLVHTGVWFVTRQVGRLRLVVLTAAAGLVTLVVLRPLLAIMFDGADRVGSNHGDPVTWWSPVVAPLRLIGGQSLDALLPGGASLPAMRSPAGSTPAQVAAALALVLGIAGLVAAWRQARPLLVHLVAGLGGSIVLLGAIGFHLLDRYLAFLVPHVAVAIGAGVVALVAVVPAARPQRWQAIGVLTVLGLAAVGGLPHIWAQSVEPKQNFAGAAERIEALEPAVYVARNLHVGWAWYLDPDEVVRVEGTEQADAEFCDGPRPAVYLLNPGGEPDDGPSCLDEAELREVPERSAEGAMRWYQLVD